LIKNSLANEWASTSLDANFAYASCAKRIQLNLSGIPFGNSTTYDVESPPGTDSGPPSGGGGSPTGDSGSGTSGDTTPPTVVSFSPANKATGVAAESSIVVTFNEAIQSGSGNIVLKTAAGTTVEIFDVESSSQLSISNETLTITPTDALSYSTDYYVTLDSDSIEDLSGNPYDGTTLYNFTTVADTALPTITQFSSSGETQFSSSGRNVSASVSESIIITFDEALQKGTGSIVLKTSAGKTVDTYNVSASSAVSIVGDMLIIHPTKNLSFGTEFSLVIASGAITDASGNKYVSTRSYSFTTTDTLTTMGLGYSLSSKDPNNLAFAGSGNFTGVGNNASNAITGGYGNDTLDGGLGNDTLTGGGGNDTFVFDTKLGPTNIDVITDFISGSGSINLSKKIFTAYRNAGADLSNDFVSGAGATAHDKTDHFLYDSATGNLYYDADGSAKGAAVLFATLIGAPAVTATDLHIY